ncbi:MAG: response regulator [Bacteroidota bacterium]
MSTTDNRPRIQDTLVLLVDDEPGLLQATQAGLAARGFRVQAAEGADAALHALKDFRPSIIVSDLVMPGTNGFELFQEVRKQADLRSVPFVFLTAVDDYYARKFGREIGGAAYITKPVDLDELEQTILSMTGA